MTVTVKMYGCLRKEAMAVGEAMQVELKDGSTAADIAKQLEVTDIKLIFVNNVISDDDHIVTDGDEVIFFPIIAGG